MAHLRATQNYVFTKDDLIGRGATCEVYKGIHKQTGQIHALKIFEMRLGMVGKREIEALKKLEHENIVAFVAEEMEIPSHRIVAVMEYCEKSLYNMLSEPENRYGLSEDEFMRFFTHMIRGMKHLREHGFLHRDIKPGNILLAQDEDGSYIYKLSDFGTAKPVMETELFQSLVGTEEYLHPDIFKAAFIDNGMKRQFDAAADLWSLGATLYHAATGRVPFQPYNGRHDRGLMFEMIARKEFGVIGGEQRTQGGDVIWTRELPDTCRMSRWLKETMTDILAHLLEGDPDKAMTFDDFFRAADDFIDRQVVCVFATTTAKHFRLYLHRECTFTDLQTAIHEETDLPANAQHINYGEYFFNDLIKFDDPVTSYPRTTFSNPLVLIRSTGEEEGTRPDKKDFSYSEKLREEAPVFQTKIRLDDDLKVARGICDTVALVQALIQIGCVTQELFEKTITGDTRWKEVLINRLETEVALYRGRVKDLRLIHYSIMGNGALQCHGADNVATMDELKQKIQCCMGYMSRIKSLNLSEDSTVFDTGCGDQGNRCEKKIAMLLQQVKGKRNLFETRKQSKSLPYHVEQVHNFDRKELVQLHSKAVTLWSSHCTQKLANIHQHFLLWHRTFAKLQKEIEGLQIELRQLKIAIKSYVKNFKVSPSNSLSPSIPSPHGTDYLTQRGRNMASSLMNQLGRVRDGEDVKSLISETEELHQRSMELMSLDDGTLSMQELPLPKLPTGSPL